MRARERCTALELELRRLSRENGQLRERLAEVARIASLADGRASSATPSALPSAAAAASSSL